MSLLIPGVAIHRLGGKIVLGVNRSWIPQHSTSYGEDEACGAEVFNIYYWGPIEIWMPPTLVHPKESPCK
jgi:hypothetical protein